MDRLALEEFGQGLNEKSRRSVESSVAHRDDVGSLGRAVQKEEGTRIERRAILEKYDLDPETRTKLLEMTNLQPSSLRWAVRTAQQLDKKDADTIAHLGLCWQYYPRGCISALKKGFDPASPLFFHASYLVNEHSHRFLTDLAKGDFGNLKPIDIEQAIIAASWHGIEPVRKALKAGIRGSGIRTAVADEKVALPVVKNLGQWTEIQKTCPPLHQHLVGNIPKWAKDRLVLDAQKAKRTLQK
ncbi:hypothetical protein HY994_02015 [Candidatus Micrarchaeota archaeon]|nr:hypothetical protein [Candidatus Micrarchaeota archaeon]